MEREKKIEKINAYNRLLSVALKSVSKDEEIQKEIQEEFLGFVNRQLEQLMGTSASGTEPASARLTETEVDILKDFVARTIARSQKEASPAASSVASVQPPKNAAPQAMARVQGQAPAVKPEKQLINPPVKPPAGRMTAKDTQRYANDPSAFARALEAMDGFDPDAPLEGTR